MGSGIALGLAAAFFQSLSYLGGRLFVERFKGGTFELLVLSHVLMGLFALGLTPWLWPAAMPPATDFGLALAGCTVFYLLGQTGLFLALRRTDASRVSPLLGLKILVLALISVGVLGRHFATLQWSAVALSVVAAGVLNWSGGRMAWDSVLWTMFACVGYSLSDLSIRALIQHFMHLGLAHAAMFSTCLCYLLSGLLALGVMPFRRRTPARKWLWALPFAVAWFVAMLFLFACFGSIGVVFGNIVQSTRGILSILLGAAVAAAGHVHLEERKTAAVLARRVLAAMLMALAIALFHWGT